MKENLFYVNEKKSRLENDKKIIAILNYVLFLSSPSYQPNHSRHTHLENCIRNKFNHAPQINFRNLKRILFLSYQIFAYTHTDVYSFFTIFSMFRFKYLITKRAEKYIAMVNKFVF
jgi:hypothetical protein